MIVKNDRTYNWLMENQKYMQCNTRLKCYRTRMRLYMFTQCSVVENCELSGIGVHASLVRYYYTIPGRSGAG